jgi:hypothetical protein
MTPCTLSAQQAIIITQMQKNFSSGEIGSTQQMKNEEFFIHILYSILLIVFRRSKNNFLKIKKEFS